MRLLVAFTLIATALAGCASEPAAEEQPEPLVDRNGDDVVVVAVVDFGIDVYHYDFLSAHMPQHRNADPSDDLPLDEDPSTWVTGYPDPARFASYGAIPITLPADENDVSSELYSGDSDAWSEMERSSGEADDGVHLRWVPGTKVVGLVSFSGDGYGSGTHGSGSASVSVGNYRGSCPECLLVFVDGASHAANEWVAKQDWIDAQTNSWGYSTSPVGLPRDRIHSGCDLADQLSAVTRGQQIFFSAGNGLANTFTAPNPTLFSCQEAPDWIVTVGAINPSDGSSYSGHGKPADVAAPGGGYPSAYCRTDVNCTGSFGGTSNATPVTAGLYGKALHEVRKAMAGPSRVQENGTVSVGPADCDVPGCALEDGQVTVHELRQALYNASQWTDTSWSTQGVAYPASSEELTYMAEGHGSFWGRVQGDDQYAAEWQAVVGGITGSTVREYPADALGWFASLSYCTQMGWGLWEHGEYQGTLPAPDPSRPMTTWLQTQCPVAISTVRTASTTAS